MANTDHVPRPVRGLGPVATAALVAGNVIGSGIYVVPASLAAIAGPVSLLAWGIVAAGFLCLAIVYADLGTAYPTTGGLQISVQRSFGDLAGAEAAFLYWISCVTGNAAFVTAFVGYLQVLLPRWSSPAQAFAIAQVLLWTLTLANVLGVRVAGAVQVVTTVLKVVPLLVLSAALGAAGSTSNLAPFAPHGYGALLPAASLVAWLFLGAETAIVPAEEIREARRTMRRSAYVGFGLASVVYALVALSLALALPPSAIAGRASPLATAAEHVMGPAGATLVTVGALLSTGGILNGWILVAGRLPYAAARQGLAPHALARIHARFGTPVVSLVLSSLGSSALVLLYFSGTLLEAYELIALASTATALVAVGLACAAHAVLSRREPQRFPVGRRTWAAATGLVVVVVMIAGTGPRVWLLTLGVAIVPAAYHLVRSRKAGHGGIES